MERNLYFENYINNLQKDIFLLAYSSNYEIISFISFYMKSDIRKQMDKPYSSWHMQPALRILEEIISLYKDIEIIDHQLVNKDAIEWLGYFYSKWHFITGESSKSIVKFLNPTNGVSFYYALHQLDEFEAIEICKHRYNISRNAHREYEVKNNKKPIDITLQTPEYYAFLANKILYKLSKAQYLKGLSYVGFDNEYDLSDYSHKSALKCDAILANDKSSVLDKFEKANEQIKNKANTSLYFCFVSSSFYINSQEDETLPLHLVELKNKYPLPKRHFDYLYFYFVNKIYEISPSNETFVYKIPLSKRDHLGVLNRIKSLSD